MENALKQTSPSQLMLTGPANNQAGFDFNQYIGDYMGTGKFIDYELAEIKRGKKWFVSFKFRNPETKKFQRFKIYKDINRKKGQDQEDYADLLRRGVDEWLRRGGNPFKKKTIEVVVKNWTLIQGLNHFKTHLPGRGLRKRSVQTYQSVLRMLYKELDSVKNESIKDISKNQISQCLRNAKNRLTWANGTFNNNLTFVKAIFNWLIEEEIMEFSPAARIKPLPEHITKHKYFDNSTWDKIRKNADKELLDFILFLYHTGTRPNEARQLEDKHILRDRKLLFIPAHISKNKKDDYVPLTDYVLKNYSQNGNLFNQSVNYYGRKFAKLKKELNLDRDYTLYSIKATRGIHLAQDGADPYTIMRLFRHSGLDITMAYLRDLGVAINDEATTKGIKF